MSVKQLQSFSCQPATGIYETWDDDDLDGDDVADAPWIFGTTSEYPLLTFGGHLPQTQRPSDLVVNEITVTPGDGEALLSWVPNSIVGVTGWEFDYKTQAAGSWTGWADVPSATSRTTTHTVGSLTNGTTYFFRIRAKGARLTRGTAVETAATPGAAIPATDFDSNDNNLIEVTTLEQLNAMRYDLDGDGVPSGTLENKLAYYTAFRTSRAGSFCESCAGYELMNDLDFSGSSWATGTGWEPIGTNASRFTATFDGNGHIIRNLFIDRGTADEVGLFGVTGASAVIANVALVNVSVTGAATVGALIGRHYGVLRTSYTTGLVSGTSSVGGLAGITAGTITTSYSSAAASVTGGKAGGLSGELTDSATITDSYAIGLVSGGGGNLGGLVGLHTGTVTITTSYWDSAATAQASSSGGGTSKTTAELQTPVDYGTTGIYSTWDDADVDGDTVIDSPWDFGTATDYPVLSFGGHQPVEQRFAVTDIVASPGDTTATISWVSETTIASGWQFAQREQGTAAWGSWRDVPSSTTITRSHSVPSLTNGTTYVFKVRAKGGSLQVRGPDSAEAVATPNASIPITDFDSNDNNLIEVTTIDQLNALRHDLDGDGVPNGTVAQRAAYLNVFKTSRAGFFCDTPCSGYELMNDLDFDDNEPGDRTDDTYHDSGSGWVPIGSNTSQFDTTFDGNGFVINNLSISRTTSYIGLFGATSTNALLSSIALRNVDVAGSYYIGALVGDNNGTIRASYSIGSVTGTNNFVGGLAGGNTGLITSSYSNATVGGVSKIGGLVGWNTNTGGHLQHSYATGAVTGTGSTHIGGLVGRNNNGGTITASYWDTTTSGQTSATGGTGKTTAELQSPTGYTADSIYETWDDNDIDGDEDLDSPWDFGGTEDYPVLVFDGHQLRSQRPSSFTLDLDGSSGTVVARQDILGAYLYLAEGITSSQLRAYTHDRGEDTAQDTANAMIELIRESSTGANPPLDLDGSGTVVARQDILGAYLYLAEGITSSQLRAYTHDRGEDTAQDTANAMIELITRLLPVVPDATE